MSTNSSSKTRKHKDDLQQLVLSLSLERASPLSLMHPSEWVCIINREAYSLFIFFCSLNVHSNKSASLKNYLLGPTSLGESNYPSAPQLWGLCPPINKEGWPWVNCGDYALTYNGGLTLMNLHDLFTLLILAIGTSGYDMTQLHYRYFPE